MRGGSPGFAGAVALVVGTMLGVACADDPSAPAPVPAALEPGPDLVGACFLAQGLQPVGEHEFRGPAAIGRDELLRAMEKCTEFADDEELTDGEVRVVYDRWRGQAECVRGLGYEPDPAPPFSTFLADWRSGGPWDPLHGVDTRLWTAAQAQEAKDACVLEFIDFD